MPDQSQRGLAREALKDTVWGYLSEREAGVVADDLLQVLPDLICKHPLAFNLGVEYTTGGGYIRVVSEWQPS